MMTSRKVGYNFDNSELVTPNGNLLLTPRWLQVAQRRV